MEGKDNINEKFLYLGLQVCLQVRAGIEVGPTDYDKSVQHIAIHSPLFLLERLTVPQSILVLNGLDGMAELGLVLAHHADGGHHEVVLSSVVCIGCSGDRSVMLVM
jgi:hypothetical protein